MARAIDKYTCPFCGQKSIFVGVHDDEGNYRGRPRCEYESDPWSGLCYALHHDGWGDCILCTDAHDLPLGGCFFDTAEEAFRAIPTLTPPNEWISVKNKKPELGERVLATDGAFVGEGYMDCYGVWCRPNGMRWNMLESEVTHWMPLPAPPDRRPPEGGIAS